ncbi:unnamed protein product [Cladocopium goreaui]|uniref:Uncharacterized protein n=1 Tax=Cladocopium goreaui TaxID=2562237 RepID=A0A9P1BFP2_9DINO|nr:unnamed protein product [Cladocopium goreaui]
MEASGDGDESPTRETHAEAEPTLVPFDVVEDSPDNRPNNCLLVLNVVFPFLILMDTGFRRQNVDKPLSFIRVVERWRRVRPVLPKAPKLSQCFLSLLLVTLFVNAGVVYIILSISSMTPEMEMGEDQKLRNATLKPRVGNHWTLATIGKYLLQTALIHYLCWQVLEQDRFIAKMRLEDPNGLNKPGLVHFMRRMLARLFCYTYKEMWLSAQFIDHLLLMLVGLPYSIVQPMLAVLHIELRDKGVELQGALQGDAWLVMSGALGCYSGLLMVGFLCATLGNGVKARRGYSYVFHICTLALATLMILEFLVQQQARQRYSQFHLKELVARFWYYRVIRVCMSASQLFATHSLCMLCAILLGHAQHFEKCPDLAWRVACKEALAVATFLVAVAWLGYYERVGHLWPLCLPRSFMIGALWEGTIFGLHIVIGFVLLAVGLHHSKEVVQLGTHENSRLLKSIRKLFDFDSFLICVTFVASSPHLLVEIYDLYAEKMYTLWALQILSSMYPLGVAVFTFAAWKQPPLHGMSRRCLWLALASVFETFIHNQLLEDCEFASATPGCCAFPSMHDVNAEGGHRLWEMCALDHRCRKQNPASRSDNSSYFCKLPLDFHEHGHGYGHGEDGHSGHPQVDVHSEFHLRWGEQLPSPTCDEMRQHWSDFPDDLKIQETSEHEESFSTAFKQFKTIGAAGDIEFNFAVLGILMKVILFVAHPNSDEILQLRRHAHPQH